MLLRLFENTIEVAITAGLKLHIEVIHSLSSTLLFLNLCNWKKVQKHGGPESTGEKITKGC